MVTVVNPRQGNAGTDILQALTTVLGQIQANQEKGQQTDLLKAALLKGQGEFVPAPAQPRSFLDTLFGSSSAPDSIHIGNSAYQLQPYPTLSAEDLKGMGLEGVPGLTTLRLDPKTVSALTLEQLKDNAHLKREQAAATARTERTKLWLQRTPAGVAKSQWLIEALDSDDPTTREFAEAELSRLQAPARRADLGEDRLDQTYQMHRQCLEQRLTELDTRLKAAQQQGDARAEAALTRLRERIAARRDELEFLETGRDYRKELSTEGRRGTGTSTGTDDMKVDDALAKLKELRAKPYFPGQAGEKLDRLEQLINQTKKQERSHVTPAITAQLKRLELQLDRAARREGVRPQPQTPLRPPPGRQSATGSHTPAGTLTSSDPSPSPEMLATVRKGYEAMTPEEAEQDLKGTLQEDPTLRSLVGQAKQQAYVTLFPNRPLQLQVPTAPPLAAAAPTAAPAPAPSAGAPPPSPPAAAAASTAPGQESPARATAPQPPQAQALMQRLVTYYETFTDTDLAQEARRIERPERQDTLTPYRQQALAQVLEARKARPQHETPAPPANAMHQKILDHYHGQYQHLSTDQLLTEQRRLMASAPLGRDVRTSLQLSAINLLVSQRQAPPSSKGTPGVDTEP